MGTGLLSQQALETVNGLTDLLKEPEKREEMEAIIGYNVLDAQQELLKKDDPKLHESLVADIELVLSQSAEATKKKTKPLKERVVSAFVSRSRQGSKSAASADSRLQIKNFGGEECRRRSADDVMGLEPSSWAKRHVDPSVLCSEDDIELHEEVSGEEEDSDGREAEAPQEAVGAAGSPKIKLSKLGRSLMLGLLLVLDPIKFKKKTKGRGLLPSWVSRFVRKEVKDEENRGVEELSPLVQMLIRGVAVQGAK